MSTITLDEFLLLPKGPPTKNLIPGKTYYIKNGVRKMKSQIDVYIGKFKNALTYSDPYGKQHTFFNFTNTKALVKVQGNIVTGSYGKSGWIYQLALPTSPTDEDRKNKKTNIDELKDFIYEKKAEPIENSPSISFIGEDYRKAKDSFNTRTRVRTRSRSHGGKRRTIKKTK